MVNPLMVKFGFAFGLIISVVGLLQIIFPDWVMDHLDKYDYWIAASKNEKMKIYDQITFMTIISKGGPTIFSTRELQRKYTKINGIKLIVFGLLFSSALYFIGLR